MATLSRRGYKITVPDDTAGAYIEQGFMPAGGVKRWPTFDWRNADIRAFAANEGIEVGAARTKRDLLAAIEVSR